MVGVDEGLVKTGLVKTELEKMTNSLLENMILFWYEYMIHKINYLIHYRVNLR